MFVVRSDGVQLENDVTTLSKAKRNFYLVGFEFED